MATSLSPHPNRPLLDPLQFEQAGRAFRNFLDRLFGHAPPPEEETEIAWEDGELHPERRPDVPPDH